MPMRRSGAPDACGLPNCKSAFLLIKTDSHPLGGCFRVWSRGIIQCIALLCEQLYNGHLGCPGLYALTGQALESQRVGLQHKIVNHAYQD
jgi:hypothetical protein